MYNAPSAVCSAKRNDAKRCLQAVAHANDYYDGHAAAYAERTLGAAPPPLFDLFLNGLHPGGELLDLGCGAGRELAVLVSEGHLCLGVDLSDELAAIARGYAQASVLVADMRDLAFTPARFDGVLAVASLLHLTADERRELLGVIAGWLKPDGLFLVTMKIGAGSERAKDGRVYTYVEPDDLQGELCAAGLEPIAIERSAGVDHVSNSGHEWLAVLARKV